MSYLASNFSIYLAGPITGLTWEQASIWRTESRAILERYGWMVYNPVEAEKKEVKEYAIENKKITHPKRDQSDLPIVLTASGIVTRDEFYIRKSDFILVNFMNSTVASPGTIWEMGFAWGINKQIITVLEKGNIHDNAFIRRRSHVFVPTLEEALEYLIKVPQ